MVVAGKVSRVPRDVLYRILMFVNPAVGHSVERVHALAALYDEITVPAAEGMLAIWQALQHQERTCRQTSAARLGRRNAPARAPSADQCSGTGRAPANGRTSQRFLKRRSSAGNDVEEIPPGAILDLDDPDVGIEFHLPREIGLDVGVGRRLRWQGSA